MMFLCVTLQQLVAEVDDEKVLLCLLMEVAVKGTAEDTKLFLLMGLEPRTSAAVNWYSSFCGGILVVIRFPFHFGFINPMCTFEVVVDETRRAQNVSRF